MQTFQGKSEFRDEIRVNRSKVRQIGWVMKDGNHLVSWKLPIITTLHDGELLCKKNQLLIGSGTASLSSFFLRAVK
jgi:hypothetical protein